MDSESELIFIISQMISFISSMDTDPQPPSKLITPTSQLISHVRSMDLERESELISLIKQIISVGDSSSSDLQYVVSLVTQMTSLIDINHYSTKDWDRKQESVFMSLILEIFSLVFAMDPESELISLINQLVNLVESEVERRPESKLISLITQLMPLIATSALITSDPEVISLITQIISHVTSMDLDAKPKPESELISLTTQTISIFNSMDLDSQPKPLRKLISLVSQNLSPVQSIEPKSGSALAMRTLSLEPEPELISLIYQIFSLVFSMNSKWKKLVSLCPQVQVMFDEGKFYLDIEQVSRSINDKWACLPVNWEEFKSPRKEDTTTYFHCPRCNGENHKENKMAPIQVKNHLHPKHSLQLVLLKGHGTRKCYCCDEDLTKIFYYCSSCDSAMNVACVEKPPVLYINHQKWHGHTLALFPRRASLTCNLCALADSSSPIYMCPPCDFVVHLRCINLPRVIRISRHPHRISFTPSFSEGDWPCHICRKKIDNDYGGFSCIKDGCLYAAHSRCATQPNVWDRVDLDGEPDEVEEEVVEPFVTISDGIIEHFMHQHHHLRLDENTGREYDENKLCQACIMPIYFGNFYSCMKCDYVLHQKCANFSRKMHHPIHPHLLTLVNSDGVVKDIDKSCSACPWFCTTGFVYECGKEGCDFQLHVQCATVSEPLVHGSHRHPLFLTSKPGEWRNCWVCKKSIYTLTNEKFNCVEETCNFTLCFGCATVPQMVRYKYDKHRLTLSYGKEMSYTVRSWCEVCEGNIYLNERYYKCDKYCCVTTHIECLLGKDLYMNPSSSFIYLGDKLSVLSNNHHMSRPICSHCKKRCPHKIVFQRSGLLYCSTYCYLRRSHSP